MGKNLFKTLHEMNDADTEEKIMDSSARVIVGLDLIEAKTRKAGVEVTLGVGGGSEIVTGLMSGKKQALLVIIDRKEYEKFDKLP